MDTGFSALVGSVTLSCFSWLRVSRSNLVRSRVSSLHPVTSLPVLVFGYCVLVRFVGFCRKSTVVVEVTHTLSGIWFLQISSQVLSRYNKLGVYRRGWLRSILFDRISILSVKQAVYRPKTPYPGVLSTFAVYDARRGLVKSSSFGSWRFLCMGFTAVKNTVCLSLQEFCPPAINREFVMECKLTAHPMW